MNLRQLLYFKTTCKHKSISKAANELLLPHQTISQAIQALESEYDVKLFERMAKGVVLTAEGEYFLDFCNQILELDATTKIHFSNTVKHETNAIRIAANYIFNEHLLPKPIVQFRKLYPHIDLNCQIASELEIIDAVAKHEVDIGFYNNIVIGNHELLPIPKDCEFYPIKKGKYTVSVGKDNPLGNYNAISVKELLKYKILFYDDYFLRDKTNTISHLLLSYYGTPDTISCTSRKLYLETLLNNRDIAAFKISNISNISPLLDDNFIEVPLRENVQTYFGYLINRESNYSVLKNFLDLVNI